MNYRVLTSYAVVTLFFGFLVFSYYNYSNGRKESSLPAKEISHNVQTLSEEKVREIVRDTISNNPELILKSVEGLYQKRMIEEKAAIKKKVINMKERIFSNVSDPKIGKGRVKMVEFFDYLCGYCKQSLLVNKKLLEGESDLQIIFKEMPIMGRVSLFATKAALAVNIMDSSLYPTFQEALLKANLTKEEDVIKIADELEIDVIQLKKGMDSPKVESMIQDNISLASELQIRGTPAYIIRDEILPGAMSYKDLKAIINSIQQSKDAPNDNQASEKERELKEKDLNN